MLQGVIAKGEPAEPTRTRCGSLRRLRSDVRGAQGAHFPTSPSCFFRLMPGEDVGDYTIDSYRDCKYAVIVFRLHDQQ